MESFCASFYILLETILKCDVNRVRNNLMDICIYVQQNGINIYITYRNCVDIEPLNLHNHHQHNIRLSFTHIERSVFAQFLYLEQSLTKCKQQLYINIEHI